MNIDNLLADRTRKMSVNTIREILKVVAQPGMVSLAGGIPAPESFPIDILQVLTKRVLDQYGPASLQYDPTEGFAPLRRALSHDLATRKGIQAADQALNENKHRVTGRYVYILDDDCILTDPEFIASVRDVAEAEAPGVIMVKSKRPPGPPSRRPLVPLKEVWRGKLRHGSTNCLCYVIRADLWKEHIHMFGAKPWGGDWWFLEAVLETRPTVYWLDQIVADCRQLGRGRIFEQVKPGWF